MSPDEIVTSHPTISLAQVHAALAYYFDHKQEIDVAFLRLQAAGVPHAGIVYRAKDALGLGEMIRRLVLVWEIDEPDEMVNRVEFL